MPTGGAALTRTVEGKEVPWPFNPAMWQAKEIVEARKKYKTMKREAPAAHKSGKRGGGKRPKTEHEEEVTTVGKEVAAAAAALAAMPESDEGRPRAEAKLAELRGRLVTLKGGAAGASDPDESGGTAGGPAKRPSVSGPAALMAGLTPMLESVQALAAGLLAKETPEEVAARRAHELELARINAQSHAQMATAVAQAVAQVMKAQNPT